jgi:hypothetical protein
MVATPDEQIAEVVRGFGGICEAGSGAPAEQALAGHCG